MTIWSPVNGGGEVSSCRPPAADDAESVVGASPEAAGWYLQAGLLLLLVSRVVRFVLLGIFGATNLLAAMAGLGVVFALTSVLSPTTRPST